MLLELGACDVEFVCILFLYLGISKSQITAPGPPPPGLFGLDAGTDLGP